MSNTSTADLVTVVGLDVGDKWTQVCVLDEDGDVQESSRLKTTPAAFERRFGSSEQLRIALEVGTHSPWMSALLEEAGHEVIVADAYRVSCIARSQDKTDRADAELLARLAKADTRLLSPVTHCSKQNRFDRVVLQVRDRLVRTRAQLIVHVRGLVKPLGLRLQSSGTQAFANKVREQIPEEMREVVCPLLGLLQTISEQIRACDKQVEKLANERYPETELLRQVTGVGPITSLAYVLAIGDPTRFASSRRVGSYFGLRPGKHQSGDSDPQLRITRAGNGFVRRLLVQSAHYLLGHYGPDSDLRRWGLELAGRGGKWAKRRAVVAVARKLSVLLHRLWLTGEVYEPLRQANRKKAA